MKDIRFERMGAFAYSHEEGTYAYQHYKRRDPTGGEARPAGLLDACARRHLRRRERLESRADLSGDRRPGGGGFLRGTYAIRLAEVDPEILISKDTPLSPGSFYQVKVIDAQAFDLYGKVLN